MLRSLFFLYCLLVVIGHNWLLAEYCYRMKKHFPKAWEDFGRPLPFNFAFKRLAYRIFGGKCDDVGDPTQIRLARWVSLSLVLGAWSIVLLMGLYLLAQRILSH